MYVLCGCFFFFKQKTAYEMRISDWSSDVCSSDLRSDSAEPLPTSPKPATVAILPAVITSVPRRIASTRLSRQPYLLSNFDFVTESFTLKIGRASCRERVCQYV